MNSRTANAITRELVMARKIIYMAGFLSAIGFAVLIKAETVPRKANPNVYRILGKKTNIYALAFSPDNKHLMAGEEREPRDRVVDWDIENKAVHRRTDSGHSGQLQSLHYSQSGDFFAIGHLDGFVSVRDRTGRRVLSFKSMENVGAWLELVAISEKPALFVCTVVSHNIAQKRAIKSGQTSIYEIPADGGYRITSAAATRDGTTFVCCSHKFLNVYLGGSFDTCNEMKSFKLLKDPYITDVAVSDDSSTVMVYNYRHGLALFDVKNDKLIKNWKSHDDQPIYTIIPFHGRKWFATGNDAGEIEIWNEKGNLLSLLKVKDDDNPVAALSLTSDDCFLASAGENRPIVVWDLHGFLDKASSRPFQAE